MNSVTVHQASRGGFYLESEHGDVLAAGTIAEVLAVIAEEFGQPELAARIMAAVPRDWGVGEARFSADKAASKPVAEPVKDADGWVTWGGGECPVPRNIVEVEYRTRGWPDRAVLGPAHGLRWSHRGDKADIIAYRLAPQPDADDGA